MNFDFIIKPLSWILIQIHQLTNDWGWAIIILTTLIRFILFPSFIKQFQSMDKMKKIQPKLKEIQDKYKDKPDELNRRTMELYQKEKVNPFSSCLPMLIQIPIFMAFYSLLTNPKLEVVQLMQSSHNLFLGFVSLTSKGGIVGIVLAVISGATTFLQTKMTSPSANTGADQMQSSFLYIMPIFFAYITYTVNAGIAVYWITNNLVGIIQQYIVNEFFIPKETAPPSDDPTPTPKK